MGTRVKGIKEIRLLRRMLYTEERQKQQLSMDFSKRRGEYSGKVGIAEKLARA